MPLRPSVHKAFQNQDQDQAQVKNYSYMEWTFLKLTVNSILLTDGFVKICTPNKTSRNYKFFCEIWDMKM